MFGSLREFRKSKQLSQEDFGRKLGLGDKWRNYPNWETGRSPVPEDIKALLTGPKWKYVGPWPEEGGAPTRADMESIRDEVRNQAAWVREEIRKENAALAADLRIALERLDALQGNPPAKPA